MSEKTIWDRLRWVYRKLPFPNRIKYRLKVVFFRLLSVSTKAGLLPRKDVYEEEVILPAIRRAEEIRSSAGLRNPYRDAEPLVSIVIPVYNNYDYTLRCIASVFLADDGVPLEIIVVDDCSSDETQTELSGCDAITYSRNPENVGFIHSCNRGAALASGEYVVFLNNDTVVLDNWLSSMIDVYGIREDVGMVGSMLLYPDGRLQEAGGIVWQDGSAWNFGRLSHPAEPAYAYLRRVDYCSGACLCLRKSMLDDLGGFDEHYAPAYYEDTDMAFRIRQHGHHVYYQPDSRVIHFEGVSSGVDTSSGVKKYQVDNQIKFFERWKSVLSTHQENGQDVERERDRYVSKRILVIDDYTPAPDKDSGSVRMYAILKILADSGAKVVFIPSNLAYEDRYSASLQALGVEVLFHPHVQSIKEHLKKSGHVYDSIILSRAYVAECFIDAVVEYAPRSTLLFDTVDLHFLREMRQAEIEQDEGKRRAAFKRRDLELNLVRQSDITLVVSGAEVGLLREAYLEQYPGESPPRIEVLSNIHHAHGCNKGFHERKDILFIGGYNHAPNVDAVIYFVEQIFPLIRKKINGIRFLIIGSHVPDSIAKLDGDGVDVVGYVDDIKPYFDNIMLSVAPLRYGAGVKGKINSSMSFGVPVVSTTVGVEGMWLQEGEVAVADDPESFADAVVQIYSDERLWNGLSEGGMKNIERSFSYDRAERVLKSICGV
jgi:GT2 family glycosyltransferase